MKKRLKKVRTLIFRIMEMGVIFLIIGSVAFAFFSYPKWKLISKETVSIADAHLNYEVTHPGWSFPGKLWSAPAPLYLPKERKIAHAIYRGYAENCPPQQPGEYCPESGEVKPRGGLFSDGEQPTAEGWTRPEAMEPVYLGPLIGEDAEIRTHLPLSEAPKALIDAIVASEDEGFFKHRGVNFRAMFRAAIANYMGGGFEQGASTLTMQVVRNLNQKKKKTIQRKFKEMIGALALDEHIGKEGVLQIYLDAPYLGQAASFSICGFKEASRYYWNKDVSELSLSEIATLVGILPSPGRLRPDKYPGRAKIKRDRVLKRMAKMGWRVEEALAEPIRVSMSPPDLSYQHPAYVQYVQSWLKDNFSEAQLYGSGLQVFTAMDVLVQTKTEQVFQRELDFLMKKAQLPDNPPLEAAATVIEPETGNLVAIYGGTLEEATDFSRATQARRQAGSSFKPMVYAMAFARSDEEGRPRWRSYDTVSNLRRVFPNTDGWRPRNNSHAYTSKSTLAMGLSWSQNVATASLLEELGGPESLIDFAREFQFDTREFPNEMGLALGQAEVTPLEMTRFVATIANGGELTKGIPVLHAVDIRGQELYSGSPMGGQALKAESAALTRELMKLVITYGTGGSTKGVVGKPGYPGIAIGKTGTTDQSKDLWFVGSTPTYAGALWLGYDQPQPLWVSASDLAAPLWGWWMRSIHEGIPTATNFSGPTINHSQVCTQSGQKSNGSCRLIAAPLLKGQQPEGTCNIRHPPVDPTKPKYLGLWQRQLQEKRERIDKKKRKARYKKAKSKQEVQMKKINDWRLPQSGPQPVTIPFEMPEPRR